MIRPKYIYSMAHGPKDPNNGQEAKFPTILCSANNIINKAKLWLAKRFNFVEWLASSKYQLFKVKKCGGRVYSISCSGRWWPTKDFRLRGLTQIGSWFWGQTQDFHVDLGGGPKIFMWILDTYPYFGSRPRSNGGDCPSKACTWVRPCQDGWSCSPSITITVHPRNNVHTRYSISI